MENYTRIVETGLPSLKKYGEIIASVVAQLSDGIWENSNRAKGYWVFAECDSRKTNISVSEKYYDGYYKGRNPYNDMTDADILKYFAKKIKQIALVELSDDYEKKVKAMFMREDFVNSCIIYAKDLDEYNEQYNKVKTYLTEHPFDNRGKFTANNDDELVYLSYGEIITVKDAYFVYKTLMNKANAIKKVA